MVLVIDRAKKHLEAGWPYWVQNKSGDDGLAGPRLALLALLALEAPLGMAGRLSGGASVRYDWRENCLPYGELLISSLLIPSLPFPSTQVLALPSHLHVSQIGVERLTASKRWLVGAVV